MDRVGHDPFDAVERVPVYDRASVERFFAAACEQRAQLMREIATARRRIAEAEAAQNARSNMDERLTQMILSAYRQMNDEVRANKRAIVEILTGAAVEAERIADAAERQVKQISSQRLVTDAWSAGWQEEADRAQATAALAATVPAVPRGYEKRQHPAGGAIPVGVNGATSVKRTVPAWTMRF